MFAGLPRIRRKYEDGSLRTEEPIEAALLITHSCELDKRRQQDGSSSVVQFTFAPISLVENFPAAQGILPQLRNGEVNPSSLVHIPKYGGNKESVANLGQIFFIPAAYFEPVITDFAGHDNLEEGSDSYRLCINEKLVRVSTLEENELDVLHRKIQVFWTRTELDA